MLQMEKMRHSEVTSQPTSQPVGGGRIRISTQVVTDSRISAPDLTKAQPHRFVASFVHTYSD